MTPSSLQASNITRTQTPQLEICVYSPNPQSLTNQNGSYHRVCSLSSTRSLQQTGKLRLLRLQIRVTANVLLADVDVGHRALARNLVERLLQFGAVICCGNMLTTVKNPREGKGKSTDLIKLEHEELCT
jgi:hypothetical protein